MGPLSLVTFIALEIAAHAAYLTDTEMIMMTKYHNTGFAWLKDDSYL
jgi:hypothetical protein